jgi:small subunit ribosomal protein S1
MPFRLPQDGSMAPSSDSKHPDPPQDDEERDQAAQAATFGEALEQFEKSEEKTPPPTAPKAAGRGPLRLGARVRGRVVSVAEDVLLLDVGGRSEAVADAREFRDESGACTVNVGDTLELHVVDAGEPLTLAKTAPKGKRRGKGRPSLEAVRQARAAGLPVRGKVTATNSGGLAVDVDGVRSFCPLSQVDLQRVEDVTPLVGRVLEFLVTEVDESRHRVIVSRRAVLAREQAEQAKAKLAELAVGQELEGRVTRLETFGAFVDLGGIEGLVHVSELSHSRVGHARDVVAVGDTVKVRVLKVEGADERRPRVSLSLRATTPDPWADAAGKFSAGMRVSGVVVRLADFGAFVNLAPGVDGLVHVSQVSDKRIAHVRDVLSPGQSVEVVVLAVEPERKRISLSIKDTLERPIEPSHVTREPRGEGERPRRASGPRRPDRGADRSRDRRPERGTERGSERTRERTFEQPAAKPRSESEPLTPMQLAFRKAREEQQRREQGK